MNGRDIKRKPQDKTNSLTDVSRRRFRGLARDEVDGSAVAAMGRAALEGDAASVVVGARALGLAAEQVDVAAVASVDRVGAGALAAGDGDMAALATCRDR